MRTTVTLDRDVEDLLREAMHRTRRSFKRTLNDAVRAGLGQKPGKPGTKFVVQARAMEFRAGIDWTSMNKLADELEAEAWIEKQGRNDRSGH